MSFAGVPLNERTKRSKELLDKVGLSHRISHKPSEMSGGEQQRVAIARALSNNPSIILADEPTGNLDTKTGTKVLDFLNQLNDEGKTIIMVTHDPDLAQEHADKVYWLKDGKIEKITKKKNGWSRVAKSKLKRLRTEELVKD